MPLLFRYFKTKNFIKAYKNRNKQTPGNIESNCVHKIGLNSSNALPITRWWKISVEEKQVFHFDFKTDFPTQYFCPEHPTSQAHPIYMELPDQSWLFVVAQWNSQKYVFFFCHSICYIYVNTLSNVYVYMESMNGEFSWPVFTETKTITPLSFNTPFASFPSTPTPWAFLRHPT